MRYLYDGMDIVQEIEGNRVTAGYIHGPGVDEPLARVTVDGDVRYYHGDHQGSIVALTDATGAATTHYSYASFGLPRTSGEAVEQPYMYTGREWDGATGLYYFRARYMEPRTGRFVAQDPIGFAGGDVNLYAYVGNNPMNARDPWGLSGKVTPVSPLDGCPDDANCMDPSPFTVKESPFGGSPVPIPGSPPQLPFMDPSVFDPLFQPKKQPPPPQQCGGSRPSTAYSAEY